MASTKVYNPNTQAWEVVGSSHASEIGILDTEDNFINKNVEGSLRELANRTDENALGVNAVKTSIQNVNATINKINEEFNEHITNHPGGSGGGAGGCKITSTFEGGVIDPDTDLYIPIFFTPSNGATNGTAYIMINDIEVGMVMLERGNNRIHIGTLTSIKNEIAIYAKDNKGNMSDMLFWTVIKGGIDFTLNFDYNVDYSIDDVIRAQYVIETPLEGELYMEVTVDNVKTEVPIKRVGAGEYIFSGLGIGVHPVTMVVKSGIYSSKKYSFNLVIVSSYNLYLSSTFQNGEFEFGTPIIIDYRVSKLSSEIFTVKLILDGNVTKTLKVPTGAYTWTLSNLGVGEHTIRIECSSDQGEFVFIEKEVAIFVGEYTPVEPIMSGLLAYFDANTMTNNDENKEYWTDSSGNNVVARLHNFNYKVNGWIEEQTSSGRTEKVLRCDNEAYVEIDLKPFKDNARLGCTIDILYKAKNIGLEEARVIDYTDTEAPYKGIYANVTETVFKSATNTGTVYLDEDTEIRLTYVIDRVNKFGKIYVNGVLNRPFYLSDNGSGVNAFYEDFTHNEKIYLNSEKGIKNFGACDFKKLRVYGRALTDDEIIRNHLADIEDLNTQRERYKFNFENKTTPAIKIYADESTLGNMTDTITVPVRVRYESPNEEFFGSSFDLPACDICYQGTSSLQYVLKNYTIRLKDESGAPFMYTPYKNGVKENIFCLKADYMESSHANNVGMAKFINGCVYDTKTPAQLIDPNRRTTIDGFPILLYINDKLQGAYNFNLDRYSTESYGYKDFPKCIAYEVSANSDTTAGAFHKWTSSSGKSEIDYYKSDFECLYPPSRAGGSDNFAELIRLVNWVDNASDELFKEQIHEYFNLEYLLRYYLVVMVIGAVDNLGKNMKLVSYDGLIWWPQFYDMDTILGLDNTGFLRFSSDIEVEAGIFNTSGSKLWEKVRRLFSVELKEQYALMRLDRFTVDNMMKYLYDEQIAAIPETVYNQDMKTKYLNFGSSYLYACHGNREQHMKKWIRERLVYCDTLMGYTGSTNDYITIRSNKLGHVYLDLETYVPMYLTVKWRDEPDTIINGEVVNHGKQTKRVGKGEKVRFEFNMPTETDQEIIVYAGRYLKSLGDVSNLQPTTMLLANASKLTSVVCSSPKLINTDLSKLLNIQNLDLHGCTALGSGLGAQPTLELSSCRYLKTIDVSDTKLTAIYTNLDGGSIESIKYPTTIQSITLKNQERLKTIGIPYDPSNGVECTGLSSVELQNCPNVTSLTIDNTVTENMFESLKYTQKLILRNSLDIDRMNFGAFKRLTQLSLSDMRSLVTCGFDDMNNVGDTGVLGNVSISNCPKIDTITFNVTSPEKSVVFTNGATLDLSQAYTLRRIEANTPVIGLNTIILNRDIQDIILSNEFNSEVDGDIKNLWSYSVATKNQEEGYEGIDFKDLEVKNIDLSTAKRILNNRNFNVNMDGIFVINQVRDGLVYPFMKFNTVINLTNYTGSYVGLFKNTDLSNTTFICNKDIAATDFTSMFEGATIGNCDIRPILNRIKNARNYTKMFANSDITDASSLLNMISFGEDAILDSMFEGCLGITNITDVDLSSISNGSISKIFSNCSNLSTVTNFTTGGRNQSYVFERCRSLATLDNFRIANATSIQAMFAYCTSLISMSINVPDTVIEMSSLFSNCTSLVDISGSIFGSGITLADDWMNGSSITTANNLTIKNNYVKLSHGTLVSVNNLTLTNDITTLYGFFQNSTSLKSVDNLIIPPKAKTMELMFFKTGIESISLNIPDTITNISGLFSGCSSLTNIDGTTFGAGINNAANVFDGYDVIVPITSANNVTIKNNYVKFSNIKTLQSAENLTLSKEVTTLDSLFSGCTELNNIAGITIEGSITSINNLFYNCTSLTSIDGMSFGANIVSATDWNTNCSIVSANDIVIGTNLIKFQNNTKLQYCNNLTITNSVTTLSDFFYQCTALKEFSFNDNSDFSNIKSMPSMFAGTRMTKYDLSSMTVTSNLTNIDRMFNSCVNAEEIIMPNGLLYAKFTRMGGVFGDGLRKLRKLVNLKIPECVQTCDFLFGGITGSQIGSLEETPGLEIHSQTLITSNKNAPQPRQSLFKYSDIKRISEITFGPNVTDISGLFYGCTNMVEDIVIPSHITNVTEMFKGCRSMTHIHSNWNNEFDDEVISTDCYAGCTKITHIDGEYILAYEGDSGIGLIPVEWGGYGFTKDVTGIYEMNIPNDNYTLEFNPHGTGVTNKFDNNAPIFWGDGASTVGERIHTYAKAGTYIVKGKVCTAGNGYGPNSTIQQCLSKVIQYPTKKAEANNGLQYAFYNCKNLTRVNMQNSSPKAMADVMRGCTSLEYVDVSGIVTTQCSSYQGTFDGCTNLTTIKGFKISSQVSANTINTFNGCKSIVELDITDWDFSKVTNANYMFNECHNLKRLIGIEEINLNNLQTAHQMFYNCMKLESLDGVQITSKTTNIYGIIGNCKSLKSFEFIKSWDTSNVTDFTNVFANLQLSEDILSTLNLSKALKIGGIVQGNNTITNLSFLNNVGLVPEQLISVASLCASCKNLTDVSAVSNWNLQNATDIGNMFKECTSLTNIDLSNMNAPNATSWSGICFGCTELISFKFPNVGNKIKNIDRATQGCYSLELLGNLDLNILDTAQGWLYLSPYDGVNSYKKIITIEWENNLKGDNSEKFFDMLTYVGSSNYGFYRKVSVESVEDLVLNHLDNCTESPANLKIPKATLEAMSSKSISSAASKGWTLVSA